MKSTTKAGESGYSSGGAKVLRQMVDIGLSDAVTIILVCQKTNYGGKVLF